VGGGATVAVDAVPIGGVSTAVVTVTDVVGLVDTGIDVVVLDVVVVVVLVDVEVVDVVLGDVVVGVVVDASVGTGFARGGDCCAHAVVRTAVRTTAVRPTLSHGSRRAPIGRAYQGPHA
jgi:hypothetical protein